MNEIPYSCFVKNTCHRCGKKSIPSHKCMYNHTSHCKIIDGKEVQISFKEDTYDSDLDTNSLEVSIATITYTQKTCTEKCLVTHNKVSTQKQEPRLLT